MTDLNQTVIAKIGKLIPRLASDHDGEVVATARAIQRSLQSAGADLHDVVAALDKPPVVRVEYREKVVCREKPPATPATRPEPELDDSITHKDVLCVADQLLDMDHVVLNGREAEFVRQMQKTAKRLKSKFTMTVRQAEWWRVITEKYLETEDQA